MNKILLQT